MSISTIFIKIGDIWAKLLIQESILLENTLSPYDKIVKEAEDIVKLYQDEQRFFDTQHQINAKLRKALEENIS